MRSVFIVIAFVLFFAVPVQAEIKIGVVNMQKLVKDSEPGRTAMEKLKSDFQEMSKELEGRKSEIEKMKADLEKQSLVLSQEVKADKELEFKRKVRDYQDTLQSFQKKTQAEEKSLTEPIFKTTLEVIKDYGAKNGYDMIVDGVGAGIIYVDEKVDVTNQIIVELNRAWRKKNKSWYLLHETFRFGRGSRPYPEG
jgi:outer membrane protein